MFLYFFSLTIAVLGLTFYHIAQKSIPFLGLVLSIAGLILLNKK